MRTETLEYVKEIVEKEIIRKDGSIDDTCSLAGRVFQELLANQEDGKVAEVKRFRYTDDATDHEWVEIDGEKVDFQEEEYGDLDGEEIDFQTLTENEEKKVAAIVAAVTKVIAISAISEMETK